ncbi:MAG: glucose-6-phosphate isomerase, partial [Cyanothece sp. SIO1E1]|nr:glucose-6-phosphate isomerase [Cyanothece sp. SIO1E1]
VGFYATLVNINAYHQPGVEAGKKAAASILSLQKQVLQAVRGASAPLSLADLAGQIDMSDQIEAIYKIVRHLHANQRGLVINGNPGEPENLTVTAL